MSLIKQAGCLHSVIIYGVMRGVVVGAIINRPNVCPISARNMRATTQGRPYNACMTVTIMIDSDKVL